MLSVGFPGFWISPEGEIIRVQMTHIAAVCGTPARYGLTRIELEASFAAYGEPWASEGYARINVIQRLVNAGWIRARRYPNGWTFNLPSLETTYRLRAAHLLQSLYREKISFEAVTLDHPRGRDTTDIASLLGLLK